MIAIAGGKGGCGKTTTTLGLARALVERGIRARAVDLDAGMPNLHRLAGADREPTLAEAEDGGRSGADPEAVVQHDRHGVGVVAAPRATGSVNVPAALAQVALEDGATLLDCPAGAGPGAATPLRAADAAILVTTDRSESVEDAAKTGRMAWRLGVEVIGAVVTRTGSVSSGVRAGLATDRVVGAPFAREPLSDDRVRERFGRIGGWIDGWLRRRSASRRSVRESAAECPHCGAASGGARRAGSEAASIGTESEPTGIGSGPTRRRDPRSRRSRGSAGTRSSSRGGGSPSGRR